MNARLLATALLVAAAPVVAHAEPADPAVARVAAYGAAVVNVADHAAGFRGSGLQDKFLPIVRDAYDLTGALALIAGPAWASASADERAAAVAAFARLTAARHAENFHAKGLTFVADPASKARGADRLVRAKVGDETLIYRLRDTGGQWRILDVSARGVAQLAVERADFAGTLAAGGVPALTRKLDELVARVR